MHWHTEHDFTVNDKWLVTYKVAVRDLTAEERRDLIREKNQIKRESDTAKYYPRKQEGL